ncbi:MAG TPA: hypothetical protein VFB99_24015 [Vicinamibacterales bacterium]|nr:hypothetical protein [Vicinamibacterales bacterium]
MKVEIPDKVVNDIKSTFLGQQVQDQAVKLIRSAIAQHKLNVFRQDVESKAGAMIVEKKRALMEEYELS